MADKKIIDLPSGTYVSGNYLCMADGANVGYKIPLSEFLPSPKFAKDVYEKPSGHDLGLYWYSNNTDFVVGKAGLYLMLKPTGISLVTSGTIVLTGSQLTVNSLITTNGYSIQTLPAASGKSVTSDAFLYWPCFARDKENLLPIESPEEKLNMIRGLTYRYNNQADTGFVVDELQTLPLPGVVKRDITDKITSFSLRPVIALLVEAVKSLTKRVAVLESKTP